MLAIRAMIVAAQWVSLHQFYQFHRLLRLGQLSVGLDGRSTAMTTVIGGEFGLGVFFRRTTGDTTSFNFNTTDSYSSGSGWQATSGQRVDGQIPAAAVLIIREAESILPSSHRRPGGTVQARTEPPKETFSYTKGFTVGFQRKRVAIRCTGALARGARTAASGSGNTFSSYSGTALAVACLGLVAVR